MTWKKILAIGAHPDDIEYGCFGLLAEQAASTKIYCYVCSIGSFGDPSTNELRIIESQKALNMLNPKKLFFKKNKGLTANNYELITMDLYQLIQKIKPDLILTHSPHDTHQEHRLVYEITMTASRRSQASILLYGILSNTLDFQPRFFKDISKKFALKKKALKCHVSQSKKYYMSDKFLQIFHENQYVNLNKFSLSESYEVERLFE